MFAVFFQVWPATVFGFGELGHQVIAALASDMLTRNAKAQIQSILPAFEAGGFQENLAKISVWADEVRGLRQETRTWHFVTLQLGEQGYVPSQTDTPNVVTALEMQLEILKKSSPSASGRKAREEALKWVVHLVGDLHQPLHVGEDHDRGGNQALVVINRREFNLHAVWDYVLLERLHLGLDSLHYLLGREIAADPAYLARNASGTVKSWVNETHAKSRGCYMLDGKFFSKNGRVPLDEDYLHRSTLLVLDQLKLAAIRLAWLLNTTLDQSGPGKPEPPVYTKAGGPVNKADFFVHSEKLPSALGRPKTAKKEKGKYAWSANSETVHFSSCRLVSRIKRKNLRFGDSLPPGMHLHKGCPTGS